MAQELSVVPHGVEAPMPDVRQEIDRVKNNLQLLDALYEECFTEGVDYDTIPGTSKPTILKPGTEKILKVMRMAPAIEIADRVEDWENGFFFYRAKVTAVSLVTGEVCGDGIGSCNSKERRFVKASVKGQDTFTSANAVMKQAVIRAQRDCALRVGMASGRFTQDMEDDILLATPAQCALILKMTRSHVFSDDEREKAFLFIESNPHKDKATEFIDKIKARLARAEQNTETTQPEVSGAAQETQEKSAETTPTEVNDSASPVAIALENEARRINRYRDLIRHIGTTYGVTKVSELEESDITKAAEWLRTEGVAK